MIDREELYRRAVAGTFNVDLGNQGDFTAYSTTFITEQLEAPEVDGIKRIAREGRYYYWLDMLERIPLGMSYPEIIRDVKNRKQSDLLRNFRLVVDGTGVGLAILQMMTRNFDDRLTSGMRERAKAKGLTIYDLVTLASLVEKEARYEEDRPIIAQVFLSRLAIGMPLQSDTTIQYLLDAPKEDVTYADTEIESPYNTYQHNGLPPGPIANPGMDSIEAVLYPAKTDYLYFVADRQGHNHYSKTYGEHLEIVERVR